MRLVLMIMETASIFIAYSLGISNGICLLQVLAIIKLEGCLVTHRYFTNLQINSLLRPSFCEEKCEILHFSLTPFTD